MEPQNINVVFNKLHSFFIYYWHTISSADFLPETQTASLFSK